MISASYNTERQGWVRASYYGRPFFMPADQWSMLLYWLDSWEYARREAVNHAQRREAKARTDRGTLPRR